MRIDIKNLLATLALAFCSFATAGNFGAVPNVGYELHSDAGCNQCASNLGGIALFRNISSMTGFYDYTHTSNALTGVVFSNVPTVNTTGFLFGTNGGDHNSIASLNCGSTMTTLTIDLKYNPLTSIICPSVTTIASHHAYFSHNSTLTGAGIWNSLTTQVGAMVYSGDTGITTIDGTNFPVLNEIDCQFELDQMTSLTSVVLSHVTLVKGNIGCSGTDQPGMLLGGDAALTNFHMDAAGLEWDGILDADSTGIGTNGAGDFSMSGLTTLKNGFYFKQSRWHMSVAMVNTWLIQLAAVAQASGVTSGTIDLRFQQPSGAAPSGTGAQAKTTLQGLGITVLTDT